MRYICSNCGHTQNDLGSKGGCAHSFWLFTLIITIFISIFVPVAWIVVGFEILFLILTSGKVNICDECKANNCMVPLDTPRGKKLYNEYYGKNEENE